jgi:hypothetical protein
MYSGLVSGVSFRDQNLRNTTFYFKIRTVDGSNVELSGTTASVPPGCDLYYNDNFTHWMNDRAQDGINTKAKGERPFGSMARFV